MLTATADADTGFILLSLIAACTAGAKPLSAGTRSAAGVGLTDSDQVIEQRIGCSIRLFFEREGEDVFRDIEESVLDELTAGTAPAVLSTGGGAVLRPTNRLHLHARGKVIYLHAAPEDIFRRLRHDTTRPLLQVADPQQRLRSLYAQRDPLYRETAHYVIEIGRPSVATLVNMVVMQLELAGLPVAVPVAPVARSAVR